MLLEWLYLKINEEKRIYFSNVIKVTTSAVSEVSELWPNNIYHLPTLNYNTLLETKEQPFTRKLLLVQPWGIICTLAFMCRVIYQHWVIFIHPRFQFCIILHNKLLFPGPQPHQPGILTDAIKIRNLWLSVQQQNYIWKYALWNVILIKSYG